MPKNTKRFKNRKNKHHEAKKQALMLKEDEGQEYGQVLKMLGNRRVECLCFDGETRIARIRGSIRKRKNSWIGVDDIVLIALRSFDDDKADILMKYSPEEVKKLKKLGEIPEKVELLDEEGDEVGVVFDTIVFEDEDEDIDIDMI